MIVLMLVLAYGGMTALCLAMDRHYCQVCFGRPSLQLKWILRLTGTALLLVALLLGMIGWGPTIGPVVWFGVLSVSALVLIFMLPYQPLLVLRSSLVVSPLALLVSLFVLL